MLMATPTMGWKTFKAHGGTRLMREPDDENRTIQVREGVSGWKEGLTFVRLWRYTLGSPDGFYTILCLDEDDSIVATATGKRDAQAWTAIFASLRNKGYEVSE
jgi:hypothetical protein